MHDDLGNAEAAGLIRSAKIAERPLNNMRPGAPSLHGECIRGCSGMSTVRTIQNKHPDPITWYLGSVSGLQRRP